MTFPAGEAAFLYRLARQFLRHPPDAVLSRTLAVLGRRFDADRAWMLRYGEDQTRFWSTHEWCRRGVPGYVEELQAAPTTMIEWLHVRLLRGEAVLVEDIRRMSRQARALQAEFRRQGNKSVLSVPVFHRRRLAALIGFDATRERRSWREPTISLLREAGELYLAFQDRQERPVLAAVAPKAVIFLSDGPSKTGVDLEEIVLIEVQKNYTTVRLVDGRTFIELRSLKQWEAFLPRERFVRVGKSALVAVPYIEQLDRREWHLTLRSLPRGLPVGRAYRKGLRAYLGV